MSSSCAAASGSASGGQVVVDDDEVGGISPEVPVLGDDGRHGLTREAHDVRGQQGPPHAVGQHRQRVGDPGRARDRRS